MTGLEDLYREVIIDHYRSPRNHGELEPPATRTEGFNPMCGDEVVVTVIVKNGAIQDLKIGGQGCSISQSSASMMSSEVKGKSLGQVSQITSAFKAMMLIETNDGDPTGPDEVDLGDLEALQGVVNFPVRIKCATLGWNTLTQAIKEAVDS